MSRDVVGSDQAEGSQVGRLCLAASRISAGLLGTTVLKVVVRSPCYSVLWFREPLVLCVVLNRNWKVSFPFLALPPLNTPLGISIPRLSNSNAHFARYFNH